MHLKQTVSCHVLLAEKVQLWTLCFTRFFGVQSFCTKDSFFLMLHAFRVRPYHPKYDLGWTRCCHNPKSKRCLGCGCPGSRYGSLVLASCSNRWCNGITDVGATRNGERGGAEREKQQTENRKGLLLSCSSIAISRAKQCVAGRGLPVQRTCVVLLFLRIEHICPLGVPGSVRGQPVGVRPGLMSPGSLSHLQKTGSAIIHSRIHTSSFLYLPYRQTERTTGSWRPSELCLSLSCGGQLGFFFGAKVSSCVRSSMDLTITSNEPIRWDQRLRGRFEDSGMTWLTTPCWEYTLYTAQYNYSPFPSHLLLWKKLYGIINTQGCGVFFPFLFSLMEQKANTAC